MRREFGMEHPEMREPQPLRGEFEYRDVDGTVIGRAEIELEREETEVPPEKDSNRPPVRGRVMRRFMLRGEKDGRPTEVDMLALANTRRCQVVVASERQDSYDYDDKAHLATVPPIETLTDVGVVLHELGHSEQHGETRFDEVGDLYAEERKLLKNPSFTMADLRTLVAKVREAVPEAAGLLTDDLLEEFDTVRTEILKEKGIADMEYVKLLGAKEKEKDERRAEALAEKMNAAKAESEGLDKELADVMREFQIREFISLPTAILERDATRRALMWARKVRTDAGIDLFARHVAPDDPSMPRVSDCERSVREGMGSGAADRPEETDILEDLKRGLDTYRADRLRLRHPDKPDDIGITPTVGRRRRKP